MVEWQCFLLPGKGPWFFNLVRSDALISKLLNRQTFMAVCRFGGMSPCRYVTQSPWYHDDDDDLEGDGDAYYGNDTESF